jgi:CPA1 family monovalent cation:H+ antiporter
MELAIQLYEFIALMLIASGVAVASRYIKVPYTIALVLVGFFVGILRVFPEIKLSEDLIFLLILPPLLFEGALNMDIGNLKENIKPISILALIGVLISVIFTGYAISILLSLPLSISLLFGAMISPTDPVSVLSTFKKLGADKKLTTIIEGESILNDGTGIVIFGILLETIKSGSFGFENIVSGIITFLFVVAGGFIVGFAIGYLAYKVLAYIDDHQIEIAITLIIAFGTYLIAESMHVSGVIAVVIAGLIIGNYGRYFSMSPTTRVALITFWEFFVFVVNSIVFLLIGIDIHFDKISEYWMAIAISIPVVILGRAFAVYPLLFINDKYSDKLPKSWKHIIFWGGLHGTIPIALALSLEGVAYRDMIASMVFGVVFFSLVIQGLTLEFFVNRIFGRVDEKRLIYEELIAKRIAYKSAMEEIDRMRRNGEIPREIAIKISDDLKNLLEEVSTEIKERTNEEILKEEWIRAWKRILNSQKSALRDAVIKGIVSELVVEKILEEIDAEIEKTEDV